MKPRPDPRELVELSEPMRAWQADQDKILAAERAAHDRMHELELQYAEALAEHKQAADAARAALQPEPLGPEPSAESEQLRGHLHTLQLAKREARDRRLRIIGDLAPVVDTAWEKTRPGLQAAFLSWLQDGEALTEEFIRWHRTLKDCRTRRDTTGPKGANMRPAPDLMDLVRAYGVAPDFDPCAPVAPDRPTIFRVRPGEEEPPIPETVTRPRSIVAGARQ